MGKSERITDEIGHVLDFGDLIIVGKDDGVEFAFEVENFARQRFGLSTRHRLADLEAIHAGLNFSDISHRKRVLPGSRNVNPP